MPGRDGVRVLFVAEHFPADGSDGVGVLCVSAALLHELGHLIVMALFRVKLVRVRLQTLEIGIERQEARSLMSELCIDLARAGGQPAAGGGVLPLGEHGVLRNQLRVGPV